MTLIRATAKRLRRLAESRATVKAAAWYTAANLLQKGFDFLSIPLFAALLSTTQYGKVSIFLSWVGILTIFITLQVQAAVGRAKFDVQPTHYRAFISTVHSLGLISAVILGLVLAILPSSWIYSLFRLEKLYVLLAALTATSLSILEVRWQYWRFTDQPRPYTLYSVAITILRLVVSVTAIWLMGHVAIGVNADLGRILGIVLINVLFAGWFLIQDFQAGRKVYDKEYWRYALVFSIPLIPHLLAGQILSQSDRLLIERFNGLAAAGIYGFAYQAGSLIYLLWASLNVVWTPWFYGRMQQEQYVNIRQRANHYAVGFTAVTLTVMVAGTLAFAWFIPASYRPGLGLIPVVMASGYFYLPFSFYVNVEYYEKRTKYIFIGTLLATLINIGLNLLLIPHFGYIVAAWSNLLGYTLLFLFHAAIVRRFFRHLKLFNFPLYMGLGMLVISLAAVLFLITLPR